jgi:hypothetical protein
MTAKEETIQQPLLSNSSAKKHVFTATNEYSNNISGVLYVIRAEML